MKIMKSLVYVMFSLFVLTSCTSKTILLKKKLTAKWTGSATISYNKEETTASSLFPFSDSLMAFYASKGNNYLSIALYDSFAVVDGLNFYKNRAFQIDWNPLIAGKNYISLWSPTTADDIMLREKLKKNAESRFSSDTLTGKAYIMEMFDITKDREVLFLKDIVLKGDSLWCNVESDLVVQAKQSLKLKKVKE